MDTMEFAMEIRGKDTEELNSIRSDIFDYLISLGADPNQILTLSAIDVELAIRDFNQQFKESLGLA